MLVEYTVILVMYYNFFVSIMKIVDAYYNMQKGKD